MRIQVVTEPGKVKKRLLELLADCETYSWVSAWVTSNEVITEALSQHHKMARLVIGTDRYITSP
ncbi:hypothetical protein DWU98_03600 [Dyella monticola]|uniref:Uncharacterized protein n=1 Tax=Dyella monticola TaxID=1927958 RepID=A0A370X9C7_9GAMM|nr:hypothetical protein DWU98_03600 [Dyella monticola]